jgi:hypothetical protein
MRPYLGKNPLQKRAAGVAQGVGPEFKSQYFKNKNKEKSIFNWVWWHLLVIPVLGRSRVLGQLGLHSKTLPQHIPQNKKKRKSWYLTRFMSFAFVGLSAWPNSAFL